MKGTNVRYKDGDICLTIHFCLSEEFNKKNRPFFSKLEKDQNFAADVGKLYFTLLQEPVANLARALEKAASGVSLGANAVLSSSNSPRAPRHISGINTLMVRIELPKPVRDTLSADIITATAKSPLLIKGVEDMLKGSYNFK